MHQLLTRFVTNTEKDRQEREKLLLQGIQVYDPEVEKPPQDENEKELIRLLKQTILTLFKACLPNVYQYRFSTELVK